jgi:hypothetical protein
MHRVGSFLRSRSALLAIMLAVLVLALLAPGPKASLACAGTYILTRYYSDATYTTQIGECYRDCSCNYYCDGQTSSYRKITYSCCAYNGC